MSYTPVTIHIQHDGRELTVAGSYRPEDRPAVYVGPDAADQIAALLSEGDPSWTITREWAPYWDEAQLRLAAYEAERPADEYIAEAERQAREQHAARYARRPIWHVASPDGARHRAITVDPDADLDVAGMVKLADVGTHGSECLLHASEHADEPLAIAVEGDRVSIKTGWES